VENVPGIYAEAVWCAGCLFQAAACVAAVHFVDVVWVQPVYEAEART
jgi:hypothetical protein